MHENGKITQADNVCGKCSEPIDVEDELCPWCKITRDHEYEAAMGNPLRVMQRLGMLDDYMSGVEEIERGRKR